jgi:hypothetical protein
MHSTTESLSSSSFSSTLPTLEEIKQAQELVYSVMQATPQICCPCCASEREPKYG